MGRGKEIRALASSCPWMLPICGNVFIHLPSSRVKSNDSARHDFVTSVPLTKAAILSSLITIAFILSSPPPCSVVGEPRACP